jgi:hypothetical protein
MAMINSEFYHFGNPKPNFSKGYIRVIDAEMRICVFAPNGGEEFFSSLFCEVCTSLPDDVRSEISDYWRRVSTEDNFLPVIELSKCAKKDRHRCMAFTPTDGNPMWFNVRLVDEMTPQDVRALIAFQLACIYIRSMSRPSAICLLNESPSVMAAEWGYEMSGDMKPTPFKINRKARGIAVIR